MHRPRATVLTLAVLSLTQGGCELVFGLDDYAQGSSNGTTGGTSSTGTDPGSTGGGVGSTSSSGTQTGGTGTGGSDEGGAGGSSTTSSSSDGGGGSGGGGGSTACPCVPDGWTFIEAHPTTPEAPPFTCPTTLVTADRISEQAVACKCSCAIDDDLECRMACWSEVDCAGDVTLLVGNSTNFCSNMPPALSCQRVPVRAGAATTDVCAGSIAVDSVTTDNPFDLCTAPLGGAACGDGDGVCEPPDSGLWCIQGPADEPCPTGWPDAHDLALGGTPTCEDAVCECNDEVECNGNWAVSNNNAACLGDLLQIDSRECVGTEGRDRWHGGPPSISDRLGGACTPVVSNPAGRIDGGEHSRLCCAPL